MPRAKTVTVIDAGCFVNGKDVAQRARERNIQVHPGGILDLLFEPHVECVPEMASRRRGA